MTGKIYTGTTVEENGEIQLVFPAEMMEELGWAPGDVIVWDMAEDGSVLIARKARPDEQDQ